LYLLAENAANVLGSFQIHLGERASQRPVLVCLGNITTFTEELHQTGRKQWVTFSFALNERRQLPRKIIGREAQIEIRSDVLTSQGAKRDLFAQIVGLHFQFGALERMTAAL